MEDSLNNQQEEKVYTMAYHVKSQQKYMAKCATVAVKYTPPEINEHDRLKAYLESTGQSANSYIKSLINTDLDSKGIPYSTIEDEGL